MNLHLKSALDRAIADAADRKNRFELNVARIHSDTGIFVDDIRSRCSATYGNVPEEFKSLVTLRECLSGLNPEGVQGVVEALTSALSVIDKAGIVWIGETNARAALAKVRAQS